MTGRYRTRFSLVMTAALLLAAAPLGAARADDPQDPTDPKAAPPTPAPKEPTATTPTDAPPAAPQKSGDMPPMAEAPAAPAEPPIPHEPAWNDTTETPGRRRLYLGLRYRGVVVPKFLMNLFADEGRTVFVHNGGLELEVRRDGFSLVPYVSYAHYFMGDTLFLEKGKDATTAGAYSFVNARLHAIYVGLDILWSVATSRYFDFEAGLGIGVAYLFGDLVNNWVYDDPNGRFTASNGKRMSACLSEADSVSCTPAGHEDAKVAKVNNYKEPDWAHGGQSVPSVFARISAPLLGLRIKPMRDLLIRLQVGASLTEGLILGAGLSFRLPGGKGETGSARHQRQEALAPA